MFESLESVWALYEVRSCMNNSCELISNHGDVFEVTGDFVCSCEGVRCWKQTHTGLMCGHALRACVHRLQQAQSQERRASIVNSAVCSCDSNWMRSTYSGAQAPAPVPPPSDLTRSLSARVHKTKLQEYVNRFSIAARFLKPALLEEHLHVLELQVFRIAQELGIGKRVDVADSVGSSASDNWDCQSVDSIGNTSSTVASDISTSEQVRVSNPRKRCRRSNQSY